MHPNYFTVSQARKLAAIVFAGVYCLMAQPLAADSLGLEKQINLSPEMSKAYVVAVVKYIEQTVEEQPAVAYRYLEKVKKDLIKSGEKKLFQFLEIKTLFHQKKYNAIVPLAELFLADKINPSWEVDTYHYLIKSNFYLKNFGAAVTYFERLRTKFGVQGRYENLQRLIAVSNFKMSDYSGFIDGVNKLSSFFPYSIDSIWAFDQQFKVCHPKSVAKDQRLSLLKKLSWGADIYPGLAGFVKSSLKQPFLEGSQTVTLSEVQRLERLYKMRLYNQVVTEANKLEAKSFFTDKEYARIQFLLGKALVRSKNAEEALAVFSKLRVNHPKFERVEVATWLADSLRYLGFFDEAHVAYQDLAGIRRRNSYVRWNVFWTAYRSGKYEKALSLLEAKRVPFREGNRKAAALYWQAKIHAKLGSKNESRRLYDKLLEKHGNSFYVTIYYLQQPDRYRSVNMAAKQMSDLEPEETEETFAALDDAVAAPPAADLDEVKRIREHYKNGLVGAARQRLFELTKGTFDQKKELQRLSALIGQPSPKQSWMKELGVLPWQQRTNALSVVQHKKTHTDDWRLYYPRAFETQMPQGLSETNKLLLWSIMRAESYYKPRARSHVGAMGLMQIMPYTGVRIAKDLGEDSFNRSSLESPEVALRYGSYYVDRLMEYFGNPFMALAAYNAGPANVKFWAQSCNGCGVDEFIESIPFKETRKYVKKITKTYLTYRQIYDADQNIEETREISLSSIREGMRMY